MWLSEGKALMLLTKAYTTCTYQQCSTQPLIASDIPDRKLEIPGAGLAGPDQEAAILAPFQEQLLCLLTSDVSMKPPAWERREQ